MEGKMRLAAAWCLLLVVVLLSAQQRPAAAMSKFCRCYKQCYADCRSEGSGPYPCNFGCMQTCINGDDQPARPKSAADCDRICQSTSVCGVMSTAAASTAVAGDADACLVDCRKSLGHSLR